MAHEGLSNAGRLKRVLELSVTQLNLLKDKRYAEVLACQDERDSLMAGLAGVAPAALGADGELRRLATRILENDKALSLNAASTHAELKGVLGRFGRRKKAIKAYTSR